jgi:ParB/RepB/Spo0J family partition protein
MSARNRREAEVAVVRPAQPRTTLHAVAGATERRLPGAMEVPIEQVSPDPSQPRQDWEHNGGARRLDELTESIREFGVLQPLVVREDGTIDDGRQRYLIIAGGRRYAAARQAGLTTVPVVARSEESSRVRILQLVENLQRQDLSPIDEARAYQELIDLENLSPPTIAARLHLSAQHVRDRLRVLSDQVLADAVERRQISATAARDIMQLPDDEYMAFRTRVLNGDAIQSSDVVTARGRLSAAGVVNPRRKVAQPKKQTSFVPGDVHRSPMDDTERPEKQTSFVSRDADGSVIRASDATPSTVNIGASDEGAKSRAAANAYLRNIDERDLYGASDEVASSAHRIALLIESALRDAQCTEVIAQITSQDAIDGMEEWWLLVYRHLRRRLLTL